MLGEAENLKIRNLSIVKSTVKVLALNKLTSFLGRITLTETKNERQNYNTDSNVQTDASTFNSKDQQCEYLKPNLHLTKNTCDKRRSIKNFVLLTSSKKSFFSACKIL